MLATMAGLTRELQFSVVAISTAPSFPREIREEMYRPFEDNGLDVVTRVDLAPRSKHELLGQLRKFRRSFEIVGVRCDSDAVGQVAARDGRVDLIYFDLKRNNPRFRESLARLCRNSLEVQVGRNAPLLSDAGTLGRLRAELRIAELADVPLVVVSGARTSLELRGPREMAAVALSAGMSPDAAEMSVSKFPMRIVRRNREKLSSSHVESGVRIIKEAS
jgi:RNase P/RNase MRP subunit p30